MFEEEKIEAEQDQKESFLPKIIDSEVGLATPVSVSPDDIKENSKYKAELILTMPRSNYTIDISQKSIYLTCTVKNTGSIEWPSAFRIGALDCDSEEVMQTLETKDLVLYNPTVGDRVKSNKLINILVNVQSPETVGTFKYTLSMMTLNDIPFGTPFEFIFTVKGNKAPGIIER